MTERAMGWEPNAEGEEHKMSVEKWKVDGKGANAKTRHIVCGETQPLKKAKLHVKPRAVA